jgi:HPt (histidine-containing phosphotransfer) domain-containing protein
MDNHEQNHIRIEIERELATVIPCFFERRLQDCEDIRNLLNEGRINSIPPIAHQIKGAGGSFGFDEVSTIGESLEIAALAADTDGIRSAVEKLRNYLACVKVDYI